MSNSRKVMRVYRAAMRWFKWYGSDKDRWSEFYSFDRGLARACAAALKKGKR